MLAVIALFAMLMVEGADADQAVNHTGNTQPPGTSVHYWTGRIEQNTTWRDTVYVGGDVTIVSGATLTLAPDTQVYFLPYHDDTQGGLDSTRAELIVEGRLHAQAEGIVFCSANAASLGADWYGIVVKRGGIADVSNATIRDGLRCLYAKMGGRVTMDHIAFANCGKPTQAEPEAARSDSLSEQMETMVKRYYTKADNREALRIGKKLAAGVLGGVVGGLAGAVIAEGQHQAIEGDDGIGGAIATMVGIWGGNLVGTAVGVSAVDPQDNFLITLAGSVLLGVGVPYAIATENGSDNLIILSGLLGPIVGAMIASELWRKPLSAKRHLKPKAPLVSVGLVPNPKGGLSAIATMRF